MPVQGEYEPSPHQYVRDQVETYERTGGQEGGSMRGRPVVILTSRGARSGHVRKTPLMRVEQGGSYALVASQGGAPTHPVWYHNLMADPHIEIQDGPVRQDMAVRLVHGEERERWWERAVAAWPDYADYQTRTERSIPVFVAEPAPSP